jgi:hypothetical protein
LLFLLFLCAVRIILIEIGIIRYAYAKIGVKTSMPSGQRDGDRIIDVLTMRDANTASVFLNKREQG